MAITLIHDCDIERRPTPLALNGDFRDCYMEQGIGGGDVTHDLTQVFAGVTVPGGKGTQYEWRGLLLFDLLAFIPASATITAAVWWFYVDTVDATIYQTFQIDRVTRTDWKEDEASWLSYKTGSAWTTPGGDMSTPVVVLGSITTTGWKSYDILSMVSDAWTNRSGICTFILRRLDAQMSTQGRISFWAKNRYAQDTTVPHHLRITYTLADRTFQVMVQ